jgi:2-hydroxychromene-2-carboxylate isomerase
MASPLVLDVYYSFRSPFSYFSTPRLVCWAEEYNLDVRLKPVLPLVVRQPEFFQNANPLMVKYHRTDSHRVADYLGLPYGTGSPDPVVVELVNGVQTMCEHQPYIFRLTYLGVLAEERGRGINFAKEVSTVVWSVKNWHQGDHLTEAVKRAGLDLKEMDEVVEREEARLRRIVDRNLEGLTEAGHWGVPTFVFNGEPFFGQDHLDMVLWRMKQHGLQERRAELAGLSNGRL